MKVLISESQYDNIILNELLLLVKDKERINAAGESVEEEHVYGPFVLVLVKNRYSGQYQIGLTTVDREFTSPESQGDTKTDKTTEDIIRAWKRIIHKIKEWLELHGNLKVGSTNTTKTEKYHRILNSFDLNVGDITSFPGRGSQFIIYKT